MMIIDARRVPIACLATLAVVVALAACDKTTTTTQTPAGTVTTTTLSPTPQASAVIGKINESLAGAASAVQSSEAASQALTKAGDAIEDGVITAKVKAALLTDPDVKGLQIDVDTRDGVVRLTGSVDKRSSIEHAVRIARDTAGVKSVDNQLSVKAAG
jgi:hyperosmotically inducible protein